MNVVQHVPLVRGLNLDRRYQWFLRRAQYQRTGRTPPLQWADPEPVRASRLGIINWKEVIA